MPAQDDNGQIAEAWFVFLALLQGLTVWKPVNPQLKYDFIVESAGRQFKVQVKCAWHTPRGRRVALTKLRRSSTGSSRKSYVDGDFDILAAFNVEERDFWLIPAGEALKRTDILCHTSRVRCPHGFDTSSFWKKWDVFTGV